MRKSFCILSIITISMLAAGCSPDGYGSTFYESNKIYTYEDLSSLPSDQLLALFIENGLEINEELKAVFTEAELEELFKSELDSLYRGVSTRSDLMYFDLAEKQRKFIKKLQAKIDSFVIWGLTNIPACNTILSK